MKPLEAIAGAHRKLFFTIFRVARVLGRYLPVDLHEAFRVRKKSLAARLDPLKAGVVQGETEIFYT